MCDLLISINDVTTGYEHKAILNHINLVIKEHDFIGVIGPNGGGKTTLLKLILGQLLPWSGQLVYHGDIRQHIGYLPQYNHIDKQFPIRIEEIVLSGLQSRKGILGRYTKDDKGKARAIMERCGIEAIAQHNIGAVSGGELQRALLCRALIAQPKLLVLDEPNTFVDNQFEKELYQLLKEVNEEMAIVMVSHDLGTITSYVKTIACVNRNLHYHHSNIITQDQLYSYDCPILLITHGDIPHTVLDKHV